jgi:hypothetical protein
LPGKITVKVERPEGSEDVRPLTVIFPGDRIVRRREDGPAARPGAISGMRASGTGWRRVRGNGAAAAGRAVRPEH